MLRKVSLGLVISLGVLAGCGSARLISRNGAGGVLELQGDRGKAMEDAHRQMAGHCGPNNYQIVQEGEEAIGTDTFTQEDTQTGTDVSRNGRHARSGSTTQGQTSTRTATAWRVHYQCNGAAGAPPPEGPPGDPGAPPPPPEGDPNQPPPPPGY
jgi:hypothetical protein